MTCSRQFGNPGGGCKICVVPLVVGKKHRHRLLQLSGRIYIYKQMTLETKVNMNRGLV